MKLSYAAKNKLAKKIKSDLFLTLTLKQGIRASCGAYLKGSPEVYDRVIRQQMARVERALFGKRKCRRLKRIIKNITSIERNKAGEYHIHSCIELPPDVKMEKFAEIYDRCWRQSKWFRPIYRIEEDRGNGVPYILKDGQDSILTEVSNF